MAGVFTNPLTSLFNPFSLKDVKGFPFSRWLKQIAMYQEFSDWYTGAVLEETITDSETGKSVKKYPLSLSPLRGTARKHVGALFGSNVESIAFGGIPVQITPAMKDENDKEGKERLKKSIETIFTASAAGAIFLQNAMTSQKYGGCVFQINYLTDLQELRITNPSPREFIGVPYGTDFWRLREAWVVREISKEDATAYGVVSAQEEQQYFYIEHWTEETYEFMVNGKPIKVDGVSPSGPNPYKVVPFVYIPHIREESFYGYPILTETIKGIILELNLRWADVGDGVNDDTHGYVAIRNVRGSLKVTGVGDGKKFIDLGSVTGMGAGEQNPDMFSVKTNSVAAPMLEYIKDLEQIYRREANHPAVADGEDEGSQRSSLTLTTRMYPLVQEAEMERTFWSIGLTTLSKMLVRIMLLKGVGDVIESDAEADFVIKWNPMLPRDRDAIVNEAAIRSKNKLGSRRHLIGMFNDVDNIEEEMQVIQEEADDETENLIRVNQSKAAQKDKNDPSSDDTTTDSGVDNKAK